MLKTAQATAVSGTATTAPSRPPSTEPAATTSAMTTGCSETCLPVISGWSTLASICATTTMPISTTSASTGPFAASATSTLITMAATGPIIGTNAPRNTTTDRGRASGTPTTDRKIPARMPSDSATKNMPRVKPENEFQPAAAAASQRSCRSAGTKSSTQRHMRPPWVRKKTVQKIARTTAVAPSATDPALSAAVPA